VIARELGFASWPKLKAAVESQAGLAQRAAAFVTASVEGHSRHARRLLEDDPRLARVNIRAAAVVGDVSLVEQLLAADPSVARAVDGERGWQPLLYACYSHWHRIERGRASGMVGAVRLLLDAGASPDTNNGARPHHGYRSALHGSVTVNNPEITRLLLERGANPNDGESLYQAAEHGDHECLRLLLANDATVQAPGRLMSLWERMTPTACAWYSTRPRGRTPTRRPSWPPVCSPAPALPPHAGYPDFAGGGREPRQT
jgi:hypothetical protein